MASSVLWRAAITLVAAAIALPAVAQGRDDGNVHHGATSCAQSGCHELTSPAAGSNVDRNEFAVWSNGPHADAYRVLLSDQAARIAGNLGMAPAQEAGFCLDCHADNVPQSRRGPLFDIAEGVTCESCHGGSGQWLETHTDLNVTIEQLRNQGLYPTEDPVKRADMCLDCHFGAKDQFAGHRLMGAGHPRISFELDSYTELNAHHTVDDDYLERKTYIDGMRTWAIGQAMAIERRMELLADNQTGMIGFFPEFVFFDCHGCHAPMSAKRRASVNRRGQPKLDDAHINMLRTVMNQADPALAGRIDGDLAALHRAAGQSRGALIGAANRMRDTAREAVAAIAAHDFSGGDMRDIMRSLASSASTGRFSDYASAEQTALVLDSTLAAMINEGYLDDAAYNRLSAALDPVFKAVESDDRYSPQQFVSAMQGFHAAIE